MPTNLAVLAPRAVLHHAASCEHVGPKPFQEFVRSSSNSGCTRWVLERPLMHGVKERDACSGPMATAPKVDAGLLDPAAPAAAPR